MAIPGSGAISLNTIAGEFGGSTPHSLSEYYAGGSYVASGTGSVPSSGEIQLATDFYGTSAYAAPSYISTPTAGSAAVYDSGGNSSGYMAVAYSGSNKGVIVYHDVASGHKGKACVFTVSGSSISFGTRYQFHNYRVSHLDVVFDPNDSTKFIITFQSHGSWEGKAVCGSVSGTSISFGSEVAFNSSSVEYTSVDFIAGTSGKFITAFKRSGYGSAVVGTRSGTSLSFGSIYNFQSYSTAYVEVSCDPNNNGKFVIAYRNTSPSVHNPYALSGSVSGTSISYGTHVSAFDTQCAYISIDFDPYNAGKFVLTTTGTDNNGRAAVGTVSSSGAGSSISFGSVSTFTTTKMYYSSAAYVPGAREGKFLTFYRGQTPQISGNYGKGISCEIGTVASSGAGTTLSWSSELGMGSTSHYYRLKHGNYLAADPVNRGKFVAVYADGSTSPTYQGTARVISIVS
tara:strand:- start:277 stop:1644 length:1368 start_codon:yes stop_codon:yes gene_type:complete